MQFVFKRFDKIVTALDLGQILDFYSFNDFVTKINEINRESKVPSLFRNLLNGQAIHLWATQTSFDQDTFSAIFQYMEKETPDILAGFTIYQLTGNQNAMGITGGFGDHINFFR